MPENHKSAHCSRCDKQVMAVARKPNHLLHFILTILTCVWGIVWLVVAMGGGESYRCSQCGAKV